MRLMNYNPSQTDVKVMISAGWHGDEPDGIIVLDDFKYFNQERFYDLNIFTLNNINEWGCEKGIRTDKNGLSPDDGFIKRDEKYQQVMSVEAKSIKALEIFLKCYHYHIALHNDPEREGYYMYTWGDMKDVENIVSEYYDGIGQKRTFKTFKDLKDGSYYDYMYSRYGQKGLIIETGIYDSSLTDLQLVLDKVLDKLSE